MTFTEYVSFYPLARAEGIVLRYLADAYKALRQTVPEDARTEAVTDLIAWLGELVRQVDSSLLEEWERLRNPEAAEPAAVADAIDDQTPPVTANLRAFRVLVRNALFRRVELAAAGSGGSWASSTGRQGWTADRLAGGAGALLRRARRDPDRRRRPRARAADDRRAGPAAGAGACARSSTTPTATTTGPSPPRSTSTPATPRASRWSASWQRRQTEIAEPSWVSPAAGSPAPRRARRA